MKCNEKDLVHIGDGECDIEGRLNYKKIKLNNANYYNQSVFKERWFKLKNNCLFYFKINDMGKFDTRSPEGVFILENCRIKPDDGENLPFTFSLTFLDDLEKRHVFAARSEENVTQWIAKLKVASYEYLRSQLYLLQSKIFHHTGKDPLLLVPRNEGSMKWPPELPPPSPAILNSASNGQGFHCHVHSSSSTSEKCKSVIHSTKNFSSFEEGTAHKTSFLHHSKTVANVTQSSYQQSSVVSQSQHIEKSKSSAVITDKGSIILDNSIFDSSVTHVPLFTRPAPSPPVRKKNSPRMNREVNDLTSQIANQSFIERSKFLGSTSILQEPTAPKRKISPKSMQGKQEIDVQVVNEAHKEDLIKF